MKKAIIAAMLLLACVPYGRATEKHLLPRVHNYTAKAGEGFALRRNVALSDPTGCEVLREVLAAAGATLDDAAEAKVTVRLVSEIPGAFNHRLADYPDEAYRLVISAGEIEISALTPTGVLRAAQTLAQLAIETETLSCAEIADWPAFKLRGFMHDAGRSFVTVEELKKEIRLLSAFKINTFHWHLTENQAWRFEVKAYPALTSSASMTRFAGKFYTQEDCRAVLAEAKKYGITVIPEIDMPGHSEAFVRAMGCDMQSAEGKAILLKVLEEVARVFDESPYIHIGADEKAITDNTFLDTMIGKLHELGKKVVCWNPISGVNVGSHAFDMTQMWSTAGKKAAGIPNIDCRYNYINHFDVFADLVGIYKSSIYYEQQGTDEVAGTITAPWNDRKTPTERDIIVQNNFYANVLASAERAWIGGGKQYIETGGTMLPNSGEEFDEFEDWERRFLLHKNLSLKDEPIPYVRQTDVHWNVTEGFANGGDASAVFAPEKSLENPDYTVTPVTGAGIYLRHTWGGTVPGLYGNAALNQTAYAYTYIYSPEEQTVGAQIEFQNYGRSEKDTAPDRGKWDRKGSRLWLNDVEILPEAWDNTGKTITNEVDLLNENFTARKPLAVVLRKGWNKVLIKLPYVAAGGVRLNKWMWTFVLTDLEGRNAVDGLIYSPSQCMDAASEALSSLILEARAAVKAVVRDEVGYYRSSALDQTLLAKADAIAATLSEALSADERAAQTAELRAALDAFREGYAAAGLVEPQEGVYYHFYTPLRNSRYVAPSDSKLSSLATPDNNSAWLFERRADGKFNIRNYVTKQYIAPTAANNTQLTLAAAAPSAGWTLRATDEAGYAALVSGSVQMNMTNSSLNFVVYNWGAGTNTTDAGCKFKFAVADIEGLATLVTEARQAVESLIRDEVGYYNSSPLDRDLLLAAAEAEQMLAGASTADERAAKAAELRNLLDAFRKGYAAAGLVQPRDDVYYYMYTPLRDARYVAPSGNRLASLALPDETSAWVFERRTDGAFDLVNYATGQYISPAATNNTQLSLADTAPAAGWSLLAADAAGYVIVVSGTSQMNMTNAGLGHLVYNWGGGTNTTDTGCKYKIAASDLRKTPDEPAGIAGIDAASPTASAVYDLQGRRRASLVHGINLVGSRKVLVP